MKFQDQWIAAAKANGYQGNPSTPQKIALMKGWADTEAKANPPQVNREDVLQKVDELTSAIEDMPAPKKRGRKPK